MRGSLYRLTPELHDLLIDPLVVRGHDQPVQRGGLPGPFVNVLDHRFPGDIRKDFARKASGTVAGGDDAVDFQSNNLSPQRTQRTQRLRISCL